MSNVIRPLQDRVLVRRLPPSNKSPGGIIIPDKAQEKATEGEVVAVGSGKELESGLSRPVAVQVGDRVLFGKYSGTEATVLGDDHVLLREDDILGVLL